MRKNFRLIAGNWEILPVGVLKFAFSDCSARFTPKLRVNPERFAKHAMGDFYTYLKASNGALPLRMVVTNTKQGFTMVSEATAVQAMVLTAADFAGRPGKYTSLVRVTYSAALVLHSKPFGLNVKRIFD